MIAELVVEATDGAARTGVLHLARGQVATPAFMPVATRGTVRAVPTHDVAALRAPSGARFEVLLANTYHLMLRPGASTVAELGGLGDFSGWPGPMLTDSGGYQVFSLGPDVSDDGAEFASTYDGTRVLLTPELAVRTQELLGADVQMVLDVCPALGDTEHFSAEGFQNPSFQLTFYPGCERLESLKYRPVQPARDVTWRFRVSGGIQPRWIATGGLPDEMVWVEELSSLFFADPARGATYVIEETVDGAVSGDVFY